MPALKYFADFDNELSDEELRKARIDYSIQKNGCKDRKDANGNKIEMLLTFGEWLKIWIDSGHYKERGRGKGQYVMSRKDDLGHYEVGNVFINTTESNSIFANSGEKSNFFGKTGINHPMFGKTGEQSSTFKGTTVGTCVKTGKQIHMSGRREIEKYGFIATTVYACISGKSKTHKGYTFTRIEKE